MSALVAADGHRVDLDLSRWLAEPDDLEWRLLAQLPTPVLDIGCGPGRVPAALAAAGRPCLGIDAAPSATRLARARGAMVLTRSVFDAVPGEGRWGGVVLLDGNIGIGGDPTALLRRVRALLRHDGLALVELAPAGSGSTRGAVRIEGHGTQPGPWFPWARVDADDVVGIAAEAGLSSAPPHHEGDRWFAWLAPA